ncbi:hypothetical protein NDN08_004232 [Rhodosorus marinus]|uniref:PsbB mRNA maturation factor Mbb1 n=1 Tax=Rhodosorus marinus TaxID=101924 RepID=A0AAV8UHQ3_9RHOD|nr:hypothetical protein NDN08_004232 [Rhodosorus marinus]
MHGSFVNVSGSVSTVPSETLRCCSARDKRIRVARFVFERNDGEVLFGLNRKHLEEVAQDYYLVTEGGDSPDLHPGQVLKINVDLVFYWARNAQRQSNHDLAKELYVKCIKLRPYDGRGWMGLARLEMRLERFSEARKIFANALQFCRRNSHLLQAWGVLEERTGNYSRAKSLYLQACEANPAHAASWVALGLFYQSRDNDVDSARQCFRTGTEADSRNYYLWHVWGELEYAHGNTELARKYFSRGIKVNPHNAATYHALGLLEYRTENVAKAEEFITRALRANANNSHVLATIAKITAERGGSRRARSLLLRGRSRGPRDAVIHQMLGMLAIKEGDYEAARGHFEEGLREQPKHCPLWQAWGLMEARLENTDVARELFQQGVWANPKSKFVDRIWHAWGAYERQIGEIERAKTYFRYGLEANPHSTRIFCAWGRVEAEAGSMLKSRKLFEEAVQREPSNPLIWRSYEACESKYGETSRAEIIFQRSIEAALISDNRVMLGEPQSGDFASTGLWTTEQDLRVSIEKRKKRTLRNRDEATSREQRILSEKPVRAIPIQRQSQGETSEDEDVDEYKDEDEAEEFSVDLIDFRAPQTRLDLGLID